MDHISNNPKARGEAAIILGFLLDSNIGPELKARAANLLMWTLANGGTPELRNGAAYALRHLFSAKDLPAELKIKIAELLLARLQVEPDAETQGTIVFALGEFLITRSDNPAEAAKLLEKQKEALSKLNGRILDPRTPMVVKTMIIAIFGHLADEKGVPRELGELAANYLLAVIKKPDLIGNPEVLAKLMEVLARFSHSDNVSAELKLEIGSQTAALLEKTNYFAGTGKPLLRWRGLLWAGSILRATQNETTVSQELKGKIAICLNDIESKKKELVALMLKRKPTSTTVAGPAPR